MYIHLGDEVRISDRSIIGMFDIENTSVSRDTREFLSASAKDGITEYVNMNMPKAFVICGEGRRRREKRTKVWITNVSVFTLKKRCK